MNVICYIASEKYMSTDWGTKPECTVHQPLIWHFNHGT